MPDLDGRCDGRPLVVPWNAIYRERMDGARGDRLELDFEDIDALDVRVVGGEVNVTARAGEIAGPVRVEAEVRRGPELHVELLDDGTLLIEHQPVRSLGQLLTGGVSVEAAVTVVVPEATPVRIRSVSADVFVGGVAGGSSVTTVSGRLTATGLDGEIALKTVSGELEVQSIGGFVRANSVSGSVTISGGDPEEVTARSVSGDLTLDLDEVPDLDGTTVSGDVAVRLPSDAGVDLEVVTVSGHLESGFPDPLDAGKRRLRGRIGDGGRRIAIRTTSGDVTLLRRADAASARGLDR